MSPAARTSLIFGCIVFSFIGLSTVWVYREAMRVKRERDARGATSNPQAGAMLWIKPGGFTMGSIDGSTDEKPIHDVKLRGFFIDRTEVTNEEFARFVTATRHHPRVAGRAKKGAKNFPP